VTSVFAALGHEGCRLITFGPSPPEHVGPMRGLAWRWQLVALATLGLARRAFVFDGVVHYRRKFGPCAVEPRFLLVDPPRLGITQLFGLIGAFHISFWR
jgi:hypothetical protein